MSTTSGHCLCRAIGFSYEGAPNWTLHCHCESCRRATSSPMATWISVPRNAFRFTAGKPTYFASSPGVRRGFCVHCGSPGSTPRTTCRATRRPGATPSPSAAGPGNSGAGAGSFELEHLHRVAEVDAPRIVLLQLEPVQRLDRLADEERAALWVERAVGAEQDSFGSIKIYSTSDRGPRPVHRGVAVEHPEVVHRALGHLLQQRRVVFVRSTGAELVHAVADAVDEERRHRAEMVSDDAQLRQPVEHAGEHEPRHEGAGLVGPAEQPPDLVLGLRLGRVVGELRGARRMPPDRQAVLVRHALEDREELRLVERPAVDVGEDLDALGAELADGAVHLLERGGDIVHRQRGDEGRELPGVLLHDLRHAVVRQPGELGGLLGTSQELDGRHRQGQDLLVLGEALHHAHALVQVPQHRNVHPALELRRERRVPLGDLLHPLEVRLRKDVRKDVELQHYSSFTPAMVESSLQRAASVRMLRPKASPSSGSVSSWPMSMRRFENSGLREMAGSSRDSRSSTSPEVFTGTNTPNSAPRTKSSTPASAIVGTSGTSGERAPPVMTSALTWPALMRPTEVAMPVISISICPDTTSAMPAPPPLYGTCVMLSLKRCANSSPIRWGLEPTPGEP